MQKLRDVIHDICGIAVRRLSQVQDFVSYSSLIGTLLIRCHVILIPIFTPYPSQYLHDEPTTILLPRLTSSFKRPVRQSAQPLRGARPGRRPGDISTETLQKRRCGIVKRVFKTDLRGHELVVYPRLS